MTGKQILIFLLVTVSVICFLLDAFNIIKGHTPELTALGLGIWGVAWLIERAG